MTPNTPAGGAVAWQIRYAFNGQLEESWRGITRAEYERAISSEYKDKRGKGFEVRALYATPPATVSADAVLALVAELDQLASDIARAGIAGFGNRALAIRDELEALTRGEK